MRPLTRRFLIAFAAPILLAGAVDADDEWSQCGPGLLAPQRPPREAAESGADLVTLHLSADEADLVEEGVSTLTGNAIVEQGPRQLRSDEIVYDSSEEAIEVRGNVRFWDEGVFVSGDHARSETRENVTVVAPATKFVLEDRHGHGEAAEVRISGRERITAHDVTYTTCDPGDADWRIVASRLELDRVEDTGTASDIWLELQGQRLLYLPWMSFPLSDRRKSGFLTPTVGASESTGFDATTSYYFNLAPDYDATLTARTMSDRGVQAQGELRFLSRDYGTARLAAQYLPFDAKYDDDDRTAFDLSHRHRWSNRWSTDARFEWVSDPDYFHDLGPSLAQSSRSHLPHRFDARYGGDGWGASLRFLDFQTLDRDSIRPYAQIPRIFLGTNLPEKNRAPNADATAEITYFDHRSRTTGTRVDVQSSLTWPVRTAGTFVVPKAGLRFTGYDLNRTAAEASRNDGPARVVPTFSLDSGLLLERPVALSGKSLIHTIEPRLYYLRVPFDHQDDLPNFDTGRPSFSFAQLFRENRFTGVDKLGDADQLALALTSRLLDERGNELTRVSIGQIRYFRDRRVTLGGGETETAHSSDMVAEIEARPGRHWRLRAGLQYDTGADRTGKSAWNVRYQPDRRTVVNAGYRLVRHVDPAETIEQADLSFAWPLGMNLRTVGRWSLALDEDEHRTLEAFGGLEYESCCWGFRVVARRFLSGRSDSADEYSNGVFLQIELKGLTGVGRGTEALLSRSIPGYENEF